jgi:plastocyanin
VTVLNGHIYQAIQKVEGNMTFHTALSTAFPQPVDSSLAGTPVAVAGFGAENPRAKARQSKPLASNEVGIDNFSFTPPNRMVPVGTTVTWTNRDDVPHRIGSADQKFPLGPVIDTDQQYSYSLVRQGCTGISARCTRR